MSAWQKQLAVLSKTSARRAVSGHIKWSGQAEPRAGAFPEDPLPPLPALGRALSLVPEDSAESSSAVEPASNQSSGDKK
jgi:hypothetical protein